MYKVINIYTEKENYYELYIKNTKQEEAVALIDKDDYPLISSYRWTIRKDEQGHFRVKSTSAREKIKLSICFYYLMIRQNSLSIT